MYKRGVVNIFLLGLAFNRITTLIFLYMIRYLMNSYYFIINIIWYIIIELHNADTPSNLKKTMYYLLPPPTSPIAATVYLL